MLDMLLEPSKGSSCGQSGRLQIEPLPPVNHDDIDYEEFAKELYEPAPEVLAMTEAQVWCGLQATASVRCCGYVPLTESTRTR